MSSLSLLLAVLSLPPSTPLPLHHPVQDKNFYLLSLIEQTPAARRAVKTDPTLSRLAEAKRAALSESVKSCATDLACYAKALKWTNEEIDQTKHALTVLSPILDASLRRSGMYIRYREKTADGLIMQAWIDAAQGINRAIDIYGTGAAPRYPAIDSITYDVKTDNYQRLVQVIAAVEDEDRGAIELFFQPSLHFALALMNANHRDEAGRFEPMENGENAAALKAIKTTAWAKYPY